MNITEICARSGWEILTKSEDHAVEGIFTGDLLSWVMGHAPVGSLWITVQAHANIVAVASLRDLAGIVIAHDVDIEQETIELANTEGVCLIKAPQSSAECVKILAGYGL